MTGWNEDNFLEKLLAEARQQPGADRGPCPDAETLCAGLEGDAPAPLREFVLDHLRHCRDCAELQNRLLNFGTRTSPEPEAAWKETSKRLDIWLEGFLASEMARSRGSKAVAVSRKRSRFGLFWSLFQSRRLAWGLGVAALLLLAGDAVLMFELRREQPGHVQVGASQAAPPLAQIPSPGGESGLGKASEGAKNHPQGRTEEALKPPQQHARPQVGEHPAVTAPYETARTNPPQRAGRPVSIPRLPNLYNPTVTPPAQPSLVIPQDHQPPILTAQAVPPPAQPAATASPGPLAGPQETVIARNRPRSGASMLGPAMAAARPSAVAPPRPSLQLDPTAHLLVVLSTAERLPDGSFDFRGTLLLPVVHAGPVPLDRGAEVVGAGQTRDGQTSLAVMEFVVQGTHYMLKKGSGAMKAQTPGTGGAVQFERSQVLEMWPVTSLVYEKAPATAALVRIQLGQTIPEVVTVLGQPERIVNLGSKQVYVYKTLRITFLDGKVSDVQ